MSWGQLVSIRNATSLFVHQRNTEGKNYESQLKFAETVVYGLRPFSHWGHFLGRLIKSSMLLRLFFFLFLNAVLSTFTQKANFVNWVMSKYILIAHLKTTRVDQSALQTRPKKITSPDSKSSCIKRVKIKDKIPEQWKSIANKDKKICLSSLYIIWQRTECYKNKDDLGWLSSSANSTDGLLFLWDPSTGNLSCCMNLCSPQLHETTVIKRL